MTENNTKPDNTASTPRTQIRTIHRLTGKTRDISPASHEASGHSVQGASRPMVQYLLYRQAVTRLDSTPAHPLNGNRVERRSNDSASLLAPLSTKLSASALAIAVNCTQCGR